MAADSRLARAASEGPKPTWLLIVGGVSVGLTAIVALCAAAGIVLNLSRAGGARPVALICAVVLALAVAGLAAHVISSRPVPGPPLDAAEQEGQRRWAYDLLFWPSCMLAFAWFTYVRVERMDPFESLINRALLLLTPITLAAMPWGRAVKSLDRPHPVVIWAPVLSVLGLSVGIAEIWLRYPSELYASAAAGFCIVAAAGWFIQSLRRRRAWNQARAARLAGIA